MGVVNVNNFRANMRADVSITDTGGAISLSINGNVLLLNKPQISVIEVVKGNTVRIEMGSGTTSSVFIKVEDVVEPVVIDASSLRDAIQDMLIGGGGDGDCACAPLIKDTNKGLQDVVTAVNAGNTKADATAQTIAGIYDNGQTLNQITADNNAATGLKLDAATQATVDTHARLDGIKTSVDNASISQLQQLSSMGLTLTQIQASLNSTNYYQEPMRIDDLTPNVIYKGFSSAANLPPAASGNPVWAIEKVVRNGDMYTYLWANGSKSMTSVWLDRANLNYQPLIVS